MLFDSLLADSCCFTILLLLLEDSCFCCCVTMLLLLLVEDSCFCESRLADSCCPVVICPMLAKETDSPRACEDDLRWGQKYIKISFTKYDSL